MQGRKFNRNNYYVPFLTRQPVAPGTIESLLKERAAGERRPRQVRSIGPSFAMSAVMRPILASAENPKVVAVFLPNSPLWLPSRRRMILADMTFTFSHDHVGITVTHEDLDTSIAWYSRNLGFTVDQRFESHDTTFALLTAGDVKIELLAGASNTGGAPTSNVLTSMDPSRLHHFCLAVADLDAAVSRLLELDVPLIGGPMEIPEIGQRIAFVTDNVGTIIELTEPGTWPAGRHDLPEPP